VMKVCNKCRKTFIESMPERVMGRFYTMQITHWWVRHGSAKLCLNCAEEVALFAGFEYPVGKGKSK